MRNKIIRRDKGDGNDSASESFRKSKRVLYLFFPFTAAFDTVFNPSVDFYVRGKQRYFRLNPLGGKMRDERMEAVG